MKRIAIIALSISFLGACSNEQPMEKLEWQGHRGARGKMPENSLPGFKYALDNGIKTLELDVVISGDGQVVVSHEPYINPNICMQFNGSTVNTMEAYNLYAMGYEEIKLFDCGSMGNGDFPEQERIAVYKPLLLEVIMNMDEHARLTHGFLPKYNIELKSDASQVDISQPTQVRFAEVVLYALGKTDLLKEKRVSLQSFDVEILEALHILNPEIPLAFLVDSENTDLATLLSPLSFTPAIFSPNYLMVTKEMVAQAHDKEMRVIPWTVNDEDAARQLIAMGVNGIITDYPGLKETVSGAGE